MKIFITGATGFLGSHTARLLTEKKHEVTALIRKTSSKAALSNIPLRFFEGHLADASNLIPAIEDTDVIIHIAGAVKGLSREDFFRVNAQGTQNLVQAALQCKKKPLHFLHISTIAVVNGEKNGEDFCISADDCSPVSLYGQSKLAAEKNLKPLTGKIPYTILRPPVLYGPWDRELLPLFKSVRLGFAPLYKNGNHKFSICYVEDVARAILRLIEKHPPSSSIFCLDDGKIHTWKNFAQDVGKIIGKDPLLFSIPHFAFKAAAIASKGYALITQSAQAFSPDKLLEIEQPSWVCGFEKLNKETQWTPETSFEKGLQQTLTFYQTERWL